MKPVEGSPELGSSDQIEISIKHLDSSLEPQIGDVIEIILSGEILETYPARLQDVYCIRVFNKKK